MINNTVKKDMMYLSGEDFYLYCYVIIVLLTTLKCFGEKRFKDYRKISFIVEFAKDSNLNLILERSLQKSINSTDREYLYHSYAAGMARRSEILKLLFTLESKKIVNLERGNDSNKINLSLNRDGVPSEFFKNSVFQKEIQNIKELNKNVKRLNILTLDSMLQYIYKRNGVRTWAV